MTAIALKKRVCILCLEDCEDDRKLLEVILAREGLNCDFTHSASREEFEGALAQKTFDLIISDFSLPSYDGLSALAAARKVQEQTPFIFLSGTIGEDRAIESLESGATDYVLKDRKKRLVSAVRRALLESQERTERKKLENQLRHAQKMEAVGHLAGGIAHDFNNLLAVIQYNADLALLKENTLDSETRENISQISAAAEQASNLTRQLLAFSRKQAMRPAPVNLMDVISNLTKMLKRVIGERILLQCAYGRYVPFVHADVGMMEQVLLNLVVNARDAMPDGGQLLISTKKLYVDSKYIPPESEAQAGEFICLRVRDTGCGIAPENLARIFEPFFTTKDVGKGTGLGLATVYGIVEQHGGWIRVSSRVGMGTVFRIFLPAIKSPTMKATLPEVEPVVRRGSERILLVEDDAALRLATRRLLVNFGYHVIEAASGGEALEIWRNLEPVIDLLITDVVVPGGITGSNLAGELRKHRPQLKVIFVSGYSLNEMGKDADLLRHENDYFLQKPYHTQDLMNLLPRCFDEAPAPAV